MAPERAPTDGLCDSVMDGV